MPCYDHRNSPDYVREEVQSEMQGRVDQLARWLCSVLAAIETMTQEPIEFKDKELEDWWRTHKVWDKARKEEQK